MTPLGVGHHLHGQTPNLVREIFEALPLRLAHARTGHHGHDYTALDRDSLGTIHRCVVGQEEVEVAIDVTKEILNAVYQYRSVMDRLKALKKEP